MKEIYSGIDDFSDAYFLQQENGIKQLENCFCLEVYHFKKMNTMIIILYASSEEDMLGVGVVVLYTGFMDSKACKP
ncbi:hypothetical protein NC652_002224 [Populus alba x Populus x berolinensis]|nr:hypothetical protein NC652_002224 [Populus alba x Populus x berolinensis]